MIRNNYKWVNKMKLEAEIFIFKGRTVEVMFSNENKHEKLQFLTLKDKQVIVISYFIIKAIRGRLNGRNMRDDSLKYLITERQGLNGETFVWRDNENNNEILLHSYLLTENEHSLIDELKKIAVFELSKLSTNSGD
jgi:hypothetical protein